MEHRLAMQRLENERRLSEVFYCKEILFLIGYLYLFNLMMCIQIQHRQQVDDLNRSMIAGQNLNVAARRIFGPPVDRDLNMTRNLPNSYYIPRQSSNPASHNNPRNPNHPSNRNHRYE